MEKARKIIKAITAISGLLLAMAISGYDSGSVANTVLIIICGTWLTTILLVNYREVVRKYG